MEVEGEGDYYIYLSLHCHHQNDFCIKVGSDESYLNVSLFGTKSQDSVHRPQLLKRSFFDRLGCVNGYCKNKQTNKKTKTKLQADKCPRWVSTAPIFHVT